MKKSKHTKPKYPEYIEIYYEEVCPDECSKIHKRKVVQIQNSINRFVVWLWYSKWFRRIFVKLFPIWLFLILCFLHLCNLNLGLFPYVLLIINIVLWECDELYNDYENLYRIGRDIKHKKLKT